MKRMSFVLIAGVFSVGTLLPLSAQETQTQPAFTSAQLVERTLHRRAVEAALWGIPIVAADAIRQGFLRDMGAKYNDIVYYSKPADWKFQTTTPNASTRYIYSAYNTKDDGPIVLEVPATVGAGIYEQLCDILDVPLVIVGPAEKTRAKVAST